MTHKKNHYFHIPLNIGKRASSQWIHSINVREETCTKCEIRIKKQWCVFVEWKIFEAFNDEKYWIVRWFFRPRKCLYLLWNLKLMCVLAMLFYHKKISNEHLSRKKTILLEVHLVFCVLSLLIETNFDESTNSPVGMLSRNWHWKTNFVFLSEKLCSPVLFIH